MRRLRAVAVGGHRISPPSWNPLHAGIRQVLQIELIPLPLLSHCRNPAFYQSDLGELPAVRHLAADPQYAPLHKLMTSMLSGDIAGAVGEGEGGGIRGVTPALRPHSSVLSRDITGKHSRPHPDYCVFLPPLCVTLTSGYGPAMPQRTAPPPPPLRSSWPVSVRRLRFPRPA